MSALAVIQVRSFLSSIVFCLIAVSATAATKTWTGAVNGNWSVAGNWTGGVPVAGDVLVFPAAASNILMTNDLPAGTAFESLMFTGPIYSLLGNGIGLTGGISNSSVSETILYVDIRLAASQTFEDQGSLILNGTLDINGNSLAVSASTTAINGPIEGSGAMTVSGQQLRLLGFGGVSSFSGLVTVNAHQLELFGSMANASIVLASGSYLSGSGRTGDLTSSGTISPGVGLCCNSVGLLRTGSLTLGSSSTVAIDINGPVAGTGYDQISVTGVANLDGALGVTVGGGVAAGQSLVIIENDGTDPVVGTFTGLPEGATLTSNGVLLQISYHGGTGNDVTLTVLSSPKTWTGAVNGSWSVAGNWTGGVPVAGDVLVFPAVTSNPLMTNDLPAGTVFGSLVFKGPVYHLLGNGIGLTGGISNSSVSETILYVDIRLAASQTFEDQGSLILNGTLDINGNSLAVSASTTAINGPIEGSGAMTVSGQQLRLLGFGGVSSFSGLVTVNAHQLELFGSMANASIVLASGSYLSGSGRTGDLTSSGTISPGVGLCCNSVGLLRTGSLTLGSSSTVAIDINGPVAGTGYDQISVTGVVNLDGALAVTVGDDVAIGQSFVIIDNDGTDPVVGTFAGLPEGGVFTTNGVSFRISYVGGTGNDVTLTAVEAPLLPAVPLLAFPGLLAMALMLAGIALAILHKTNV